MEHTVYLVLAVAGCTLLLLQVLMQVFGLAGGEGFDAGDGHADVGHGDHAHASDPGHGSWFFGILSLKALCAFAGIFGLTGLALLEAGLAPWLRVTVAVEAGIVAMVVVGFLMRGLSRLSASGTLDVANAVGRPGSVYLRVPAAQAGRGKVTVEVQGRTVELDAVTDGAEIPTGARIAVVEVVDAETLKVVRAEAGTPAPGGTVVTAFAPWLAAVDSSTYTMLIVVFGVITLFSFLLLLIKRYKRCPSNKVLVVYGKVGGGGAAKTIHGGGTFVWPLIQDWDFLDLEPLQIEIPLKGALSIENIRVNVPSVFTVAIGTEPAVMQNAAIRLLNLDRSAIEAQARDIIFGQLRQVIASMQIQEINRDRDQFLASIQKSLEPELKKIGLVLINVNITDITDESGYIEAIGRKAAATAVQQAEVDVAEQVKKGAVGVALANRTRDVDVAVAEKERDIGTKDAERERRVQVADLDRRTKVGEQTAGFQRDAEVADAEREKRIKVAEADARAVKGENEAKVVIARTNADLQVEKADAYLRSETKRRVAEAEVLSAQYAAQALAAAKEADKVEAEKTAALVAPARAQKAKVLVDAEAEAEKRRIEAEGEARAIFARLEAEARGQYEILAKKGHGFAEIVRACGDAQSAFQMLMLEHLDRLSENAAKAISNIRFDKVVVWDGGATGPDGRSATAGFLANLAQSLPPMLQMMKDIGGVEMPGYFGKLVGTPTPKDDGTKGDGTKGEGPRGDRKGSVAGTVGEAPSAGPADEPERRTPRRS